MFRAMIVLIGIQILCIGQVNALGASFFSCTRDTATDGDGAPSKGALKCVPQANKNPNFAKAFWGAWCKTGSKTAKKFQKECKIIKKAVDGIATGETGNEISRGMAKAKSMASGAMNKTKSMASGAMNKTKSMASGAMNKTKSMASGAMNKTKSMASGAMNKTKSMANSTKKKAKKMPSALEEDGEDLENAVDQDEDSSDVSQEEEDSQQEEYTQQVDDDGYEGDHYMNDLDGMFPDDEE